jgi:hypothetical protein
MKLQKKKINEYKNQKKHKKNHGGKERENKSICYYQQTVTRSINPSQHVCLEKNILYILQNFSSILSTTIARGYVQE